MIQFNEKMLKQDLLPPGKKGIRFFILTAVPLLWSFTIGCDETFEPWQENDQYHFSIYGFLDASADTQWVRIMPVREDLFLEPEPIDATVILTHVESGESVVMNDSLFSDVHGRYTWNFWTTLELYPEQTYRINAKRSNGDSSYVEITLPNDFPTPVVLRDRRSATVIIKNIEQLVDLRTLYFIRYLYTEDESLIPFVHLQDTFRTASGDFTIAMDPRDDLNTLESLLGSTPRTMFDQQIFIASGGPDFHYFPLIDEKITALPEGISNVVNGTCYLAGVVSKTIPYQSCLREGTIDPIPCETEPYPWSLNIPVWNINSRSP